MKKLIKKIAKSLDENKIPYIIIGGQALLIHGEPRLTKDIDITLGISPEHIDKIVLICKKLNFKILPSNYKNFVLETWVLPVIDKKSNIRIDFIFSNSDYEKEAINRGININIDNYTVKFATVEDLIIHKLIAQRERDIEDIKKLLLKNKVDLSYIKKWLSNFEKIFNINFLEQFERIKNDKK